VLGLSLTSGTGSTLSLLIGELAYGAGSDRDEHVRVAVLLGSVTAAVPGAVVLGSRNRVYRRLQEATRPTTTSTVPRTSTIALASDHPSRLTGG
jgi:NhaA family Na+:H+ antiporter